MPVRNQDDVAKFGSALLDAVKSNKIDVVKSLLNDSSTALTYYTNKDGNNVLHHAVLNQNPRMIALLLRHGADITAKNYAGDTPIQLAGIKNFWPCVEAFADNRIDVDGKGNYGSALLYAVGCNENNLVKKLLDAKAATDWNWRNTNDTPLHQAVINGNSYLISLLLQYGADIGKKNKDNKTPIEMASAAKKWQCVETFAVSRSDDEKGKGNYGSALIDAIKEREYFAVEKLLNANAKLTWNIDGDYPLHIATAKGYRDFVKVLLTHNANINQQNKAGNTPVHLAVMYNSPRVLSLLLKYHPDLSIKNDNGKTAIQVASEAGIWNCVKQFPVSDKEIHLLSKFKSMWTKESEITPEKSLNNNQPEEKVVRFEKVS